MSLRRWKTDFRFGILVLWYYWNNAWLDGVVAAQERSALLLLSAKVLKDSDIEQLFHLFFCETAHCTTTCRKYQSTKVPKRKSSCIIPLYHYTISIICICILNSVFIVSYILLYIIYILYIIIYKIKYYVTICNLFFLPSARLLPASTAKMKKPNGILV